MKRANKKKKKDGPSSSKEWPIENRGKDGVLNKKRKRK